MKHKKYGKNNKVNTTNNNDVDDNDDLEPGEEVQKIHDIYKFVERREITGTVKNVGDLRELGSIYSKRMLKYSKKATPPVYDAKEFDEEETESSFKHRLLKLPIDGSIFHDGIPFHHLALTQLSNKHINRLKQNGIEIKSRHFSPEEDKQILENWHSFATAHKIPECEAARYMGAATASESSEGHKERIRFTHNTLLRPWMCAKLLDRTASQVFRRCYHLFRVSSLDIEDNRKWTTEDNEKLLELVRLHGMQWEYIGNELFRPRYSCYRQYQKLTRTFDHNNETEHEEVPPENSDAENVSQRPTASEGHEWNKVELARLYNFLAGHLPRNPVIIATVPKLQHLDSHIDWNCSEMKLPRRSAEERKARWEELKLEFKTAKKRIQSDIIKHILREIFPEDTTILARAKIPKKHKYFTPEKMSKDIDSLKQYCKKTGIETLRDISIKELEKSMCHHSGGQRYPTKQFIRRVRYLLFAAQRAQVFKLLPFEHDVFSVRLELLTFIFRNIKKFMVKKKSLRKYTRRFIRINGWEQRKQIVYVQNVECS